jgi:hypothetical protein
MAQYSEASMMVRTRAIGGSFRPELEFGVAIVDLPKQLSAAQVEGAEIALAVWIVAFRKIAESGDCT